MPLGRQSLNIVIYTVVIVIVVVVVDATIGLSPPRNYPTPRVQSATAWTASVHTLTLNAQTCDNVRAQSATGRTASVHTLHMLKPVITFLFKVLRHGLLRLHMMMIMTMMTIVIRIMITIMTMIMIIITIMIFTTHLRHEKAHRNQWNYVIGSS